MVKNVNEKIAMLEEKIEKESDNIKKSKLNLDLVAAEQTKELVNWFKKNEYSKLEKTPAINLSEINKRKVINGTGPIPRCYDLVKQAKKLDIEFNGNPRSEKYGKYALQKCLNETGDIMAFNEMSKSRQQEFENIGQNITDTSAFGKSNIRGFNNLKPTATQIRLNNLKKSAACLEKNGDWDDIQNKCTKGGVEIDTNTQTYLKHTQCLAKGGQYDEDENKCTKIVQGKTIVL
tara:strand:- start:9 stop:707 length:699 start_codon:yes stop_codon:yes gene_type:complete